MTAELLVNGLCYDCRIAREHSSASDTALELAYRGEDVPAELYGSA